MKRFTLLLSAMLLACATSVWADVLSIDFESKPNAYTDWIFTNMMSQQTGTITAHGGTSYGTTGGNATASITTKNAISNPQSITFYVSKQTTNTTSSSWKIQVSSDNSTWTDVKTQSATSMSKGSWVEVTQDLSSHKNVYVRIYYTGSTAVRNIDDISLTYSTVAAAVADPIISADDDNGAIANNGFYTNYLLVNITCETEGAAIRYTLDGTEPTSESALYDGSGIDFTNEFVTLRAKAFKGEDASYEATANYYHNSSLEVPYTTTQAVALYNALGDVKEVFVEGSVDGNPTYYASSSSSNYNITDGTTLLYIYRGVAGADCGLTNLADLVQGDKVVVKGKLTAYNGTLQLGSGNTIVKWTENTNPVLTCAESIAFGNISTLVGTIPSKTLEVTAKNLTEDISVTLSTDAAFTLDNTNFDVRNGGTIGITPVLTVGEHTATLTLTSGEKSVTVALTATIQQAYTISWVVNGVAYTTGEPTASVIEGEKVIVLPTAPADNTLSCSTLFVGWSTNNLGSTAGQTQPDDLFTTIGAAPVVTENTTYHAVFATADGEAKEYFKETFDQTNGTGGNDGSWSGSIASSDLKTDNQNWTFVSGAGANKCAKIGTGKAQGSAKTPALADLTGDAVLTFRAGAWDGDATTLNLSISAGALSDTTVTLKNAAFSDYTITITGATAESKITFQGKQKSNSRFFLDEVVVKSAVTLKDFRTNCEGVSTAINNAAVETPAVKTIENGQLIILRDGVKYNAMGVRLQ